MANYGAGQKPLEGGFVPLSGLNDVFGSGNNSNLDVAKLGAFSSFGNNKVVSSLLLLGIVRPVEESSDILVHGERDRSSFVVAEATVKDKTNNTIAFESGSGKDFNVFNDNKYKGSIFSVVLKNGKMVTAQLTGVASGKITLTSKGDVNFSTATNDDKVFVKHTGYTTGDNGVTRTSLPETYEAKMNRKEAKIGYLVDSVRISKQQIKDETIFDAQGGEKTAKKSDRYKTAIEAYTNKWTSEIMLGEQIVNGKDVHGFTGFLRATGITELTLTDNGGLFNDSDLDTFLKVIKQVGGGKNYTVFAGHDLSMAMIKYLSSAGYDSAANIKFKGEIVNDMTLYRVNSFTFGDVTVYIRSMDELDNPSAYGLSDKISSTSLGVAIPMDEVYDEIREEMTGKSTYRYKPGNLEVFDESVFDGLGVVYEQRNYENKVLKIDWDVRGQNTNISPASIINFKK